MVNIKFKKKFCLNFLANFVKSPVNSDNNMFNLKASTHESIEMSEIVVKQHEKR